MISRQFFSHCMSLFLYLFCIQDSLARVDICRTPIAYSYLSMEISSHNKSAFERNLGETEQENFNLDLIIRSEDNSLLFGVGYRYSFFNIDMFDPQTNGYLHTFFLPLHRISQNDVRSFRFSIAPALSASSNVMKNPGRYTVDAFQLLAALVWDWRLSDRVSLQYGLCGDHRFGNYRIYPLIGVHWQLHPVWTIELGYPTSQLRYQFSAGSTSSLQITPDGNEWYVLDKNLAQHSQFVYQSYALEWSFDWQLGAKLTLTTSVGRQLHNHYEMTLRDGSRVRLAGESATRFAARLRWRF
ncbi:MAG: hypothetical protein IIB68_03330 [Proteobacteria bacterium]|nr:hypothetical protein [Pseudomonadota bacterium]